MSFKDDLQNQFNSLKITIINEPKNKHHLYADYVELICLFTNDLVSKSDVIDRLKDNNETFEIKNDNLDGETGDVATEISDTEESWINNIFELLIERKTLYGKSYPFIINTNQIRIKKRLSSQTKIYLFLLISSMLNFFKTLQNILTSEFELLSKKVLIEYLPKKAIVKSFGNNSAFVGNTKSKIKQLAELLNIETRDYELNQISDRNSKDEGLDIIGWIPFADSNPNALVLLVQCGCGKDWSKKTHDTSRYENFYDFYRQPPIHLLFIPYAISSGDGKFYQSKDIVKPILIFERFRILEYTHKISFNNNFSSRQIVDKCIKYKEDIV